MDWGESRGIWYQGVDLRFLDFTLGEMETHFCFLLIKKKTQLYWGVVMCNKIKSLKNTHFDEYNASPTLVSWPLSPFEYE